MKKLIVVVLTLCSLAGCAEFAGVGLYDDLGRVWYVSDYGWNGVWTRRGYSRTFDAVWKDASGREVRDEVIHESTTGAQIVLFRVGTNGRYRGTLSGDRRRVENGTAEWVKSAGGWSATITR